MHRYIALFAAHNYAYDFIFLMRMDRCMIQNENSQKLNFDDEKMKNEIFDAVIDFLNSDMSLLKGYLVFTLFNRVIMDSIVYCCYPSTVKLACI